MMKILLLELICPVLYQTCLNLRTILIDLLARKNNPYNENAQVNGFYFLREAAPLMIYYNK